MQDSNFTLVLTEPNGNFATPDIVITNDFETSFSIQNAADISQRKDSISKSVTFPGTKNNNRIFNNLYSLNRTSDSSLAEVLFSNYSPNVAVKTILLENGFPLLIGDLKINDISRDKATGAFTYTGIITGRTVSFFGKIKDLLLTDLTNFADTITYSWANIMDSWYFADTKKFVIPMIDYGKGIVSRRDKFDIRNFRPAIYVREYIKRILASQGYSYTSAYIDSDSFKRAFIPFNDAEFGKTIFGNVQVGNGGTATYPILRDNDFMDMAGMTFSNVVDNGTIGYASNVNIAGIDSTLPNDDGKADFTGSADVFEFKRFSNTAVKFDCNVTVASSGGDTFYSLKIFGYNPGGVAGSDIDNAYPIAQTAETSFSGNTSSTTQFSVSLPYGTYQKGMRFICTVIVRQTSIDKQADVTLSNQVVTFGNPDAAVGSFFNIALGDTFLLSDAVPKNEKCLDLMKSILQFYNMYIIPNPDKDNDFVIEPYDTFYTKASNPVLVSKDWTKKIDQSSIHLTVNTELPKTYNFNFKEDGDYYSTLYKNTYNDTYGNFSIDNSNGSADAKTIEVAFSSTIVVKESTDDKVMPAIYGGTISAKESFKSNLRILFNCEATACQAYDVVLTTPGNPPTYATVVAGVTMYQLSHHVLSLSAVQVFNLLFGLPKAVYYPVTGSIFTLPTIYTKMYKKQLAELNDNDVFTMEVDGVLNESDINNLDLRVPIFISTTQGYAYFKVMSVTYYSRTELSQIVLQKIIL